ncbi:MAG: GNAT family N-acetyltransferase [Anaerobiospirillum succiniciproducens]|uniref:GNAT family N-acetyltransferase n=1 Tax=Anaerobiospirillum succiniciproducens TaxID=13335 RepID=UPI002A748D50|nr:GNAT family N-acetyltransferase [Anaerobiospirillum succiniciproducens]MDY2798034.1 GNAT family N-acetyltransferase [Anaerobiospirillum succiniciproducens]
MSELDLDKFLVSIEHYDHSRHFDKVFCLACEYLSSFFIYSSSSFYYNGASSCKHPHSTCVQANTSRLQTDSSYRQDSLLSCSNCDAPLEQASTCLQLCEQCFDSEQAYLVIKQSQEICERLVKHCAAMQIASEISDNAKLNALIDAELKPLYCQESSDKRIPSKLLCEILAHIIHLLTAGHCLLATVSPLAKSTNSTAEHLSSSVVGLLHYETGNYSKNHALLLEQSVSDFDSCIPHINSYCYISKVYVRPVCRRQGIATELIHAAGDYCAQQNSIESQNLSQAKTLLFLDTIRTFAPAISLYKSLSFKHLPAALLPDNFAFDSSKMYLYTLR